jgi:hypothetical protein
MPENNYVPLLRDHLYALLSQLEGNVEPIARVVNQGQPAMLIAHEDGIYCLTIRQVSPAVIDKMGQSVDTSVKKDYA